MDTKIEAQNHENQEQLYNHYEKLLNRKYAKYPYVKSIDLKIDQVQEGVKVGMRIKPEKGSSLYASSIDINEHSAAQQTIKKMNKLIEKYKEQRYHKNSTVHKSTV